MKYEDTPRMKRDSHEWIQEMRREFGITEDESSPEELERERVEREARMKRVEEAGTIENYVKLYNRDYWTDRWLGPGPEPPMPYLEEMSKKDQKKLKKAEHEEWKNKYLRPVDTYRFEPEKESKEVRKLRKKRKKQESAADRQKKYDLAYWFLEVFLKPKFAQEIYTKFAGQFEDMVDYCCEYAIQWATYMTYDPENHDLSIDDVFERMEARREERDEVVQDIGGLKFKRLAVAERKKRYYEVDLTEDSYPDIPDEYWEEYSKWCDEHPLKKYKKKAKKLGWGISAAGVRRAEFIKKINKRNKGFRKRMMLHDPLTGSSFVSEKKMNDHIKKQLKKYDEKRQEFADMLDKMVERGEISEDMAIDWMGNTKEARDRVAKRYKLMRSRIKDTHDIMEKRASHKRKVDEARRDWFKKFGGKISDTPFKVDFDGETNIIQNIGKNGKDLYRIVGDGYTMYSESTDF